MNVSRKVGALLCIGLALVGSACGKAEKRGVASPSTTVMAATASPSPRQTPNSVSAILRKPEVPILCYHRIAVGKKGDYTVSPATFEAHMKVLSDSGFHAISPDQLYAWLVYDAPLPKNPVMITFDDSRAEHSAIAAPILEKYGFRGVFFIMTITYNKTNYMTKEQIAALAKKGHTIGLHTWDHRMVTRYTEASDWQTEIVEPLAKLEQVCGTPVRYFAYPNGVINHAASQQLSAHFRLSFILSTKRDTLLPLQTVRRIIAPECSPVALMRSLRRTFHLH